MFHAGTALTAGGTVVTSGGRVLAVTSYGKDLAEALKRSYASLANISFEGMNFRRDIGRDVM